jgi:hypothetical protein
LVAGLWRRALAGPLADLVSDRLVVDLRSTAYAGMWRPGRDDVSAGRVATVRVLHERMVSGVLKRSVVSHFNKATKGRVARALLCSGAELKTARELADALRDLGFRVEDGGAGVLDLVVAEV